MTHKYCQDCNKFIKTKLGYHKGCPAVKEQHNGLFYRNSKRD